MIKKTSQILDTTKASMNNVDAASDRLKSISSKIDQGKGTLGALVNDRTVYTQLSAATAQAKVGASAFAEDAEALKRNWFLRGYFKKRGYYDSTDLTKQAIDHLPRAPSARNLSTRRPRSSIRRIPLD